MGWSRRKAMLYDSDIRDILRKELAVDENLEISYFRDGTTIVSRTRYFPVFTQLCIHINRPTKAGLRKGIKYVMDNMNMVLKSHDVNKKEDI